MKLNILFKTFLYVLFISNTPIIFTNTYFVTNLNDSGLGSLRQAIEDANANPGLDTIVFTGVSGTIIPLTSLPIITDPVIIDGYTAFGATPNTNPLDLPNNANITIGIQGPGPVEDGPIRHGLQLGFGSDGSTIRGLFIHSFASVRISDASGAAGIVIQSDFNTIEGNFIGTDSTGTTSLPNFRGIVDVGFGNLIGGFSNEARNLIAGHYGGVVPTQAVITSSSLGDSIITGNTIGLDRSGTIPLMAEAQIGIFIAGALNSSADTNVKVLNNRIAGQGESNVMVVASTNILIQNNYIGTDITGTQNPGNNGVGIKVSDAPFDGASGIIIDENVISGNTYGITVGENFRTLPMEAVQITNNFIGTTFDGSDPLPNELDGIWIKYGIGTFIGFNLIADNERHGIRAAKSKCANIKGNTILENEGDGIRLGTIVGAGVPSFGDTIGGALPDQGNLIADNGGNGISLISCTQEATIQGNEIVDNGQNGIYLGPQTKRNHIGGFRSCGDLLLIGALETTGSTNLGPLGTTNIIDGNELDGIFADQSTHNEMQTNVIENNSNGITLLDSSFNLVGGKFGGSSTEIPPVLGNSISKNDGYGVGVIQDEGNATDNSILSNSIALNAQSGIELIAL